jgi:hypothetical protein
MAGASATLLTVVASATWLARACNWMRWVRTNRRFGSWCALLAIAIQIIVSFGHAHRIEGFRQGELLPQAAGIYGQSMAERGDPASKPIGLPFEYCAICVVIKMGASTVPAEAPASSLPVIAGKARFTPHVEAATSTLGHLLFQARAPPSA